MIRWLRAMGAFCYDFVVGDDWPLTAAVALGLGLTAVLSGAGLAGWWTLPAVIGIALPARVWAGRQR